VVPLLGCYKSRPGYLFPKAALLALTPRPRGVALRAETVKAPGPPFVDGSNDLYKQAMTWREQIAGTFGFGTAPFALHRADEDLAKEAIRAAKAEGASREQFAHEIALYAKKYISSEGILRERLRRDSATLEKLWKISR
jgi:hypothetical protein